MKKNTSVIFWVVCILFFMLSLHTIMYYSNIVEGVVYEQSTTTLSYIYLGTSILLWGYLIFWLFKLFVSNVFITKRNIENLLRNGTILEGTIEKDIVLSTTKEGYNVMNLTVLLKNFVNESISESIQIVDSKPYENRYKTGNKLRLRIDPELKSTPYWVVEGSKISVKPLVIFLRLILLLLFVVAIVYYYCYALKTEGGGNHWNFLKIMHPLVVTPATILSARFSLGHFLRKFFGAGNSKNTKIKYYGVRTVATVINIAQTGTYISNQPQVKIELEYTDASGQLRRTKFKKVVSLLDLATLKQSATDIFYERDNPSNIALADDLT